MFAVRTELCSRVTALLIDSVTLNHHDCFVGRFWGVFHTWASVGPKGRDRTVLMCFQQSKTHFTLLPKRDIQFDPKQTIKKSVTGVN